MLKKTAFVILSFLLAVASLISCTSERNDILTIGDVSAENADVSVGESDILFSTDENGITEALFKYLYLYFKDSLLSQAEYYESMGMDITGSDDIVVGDTEAFWGCTLQENEDGTITTMKDYVYDSTLSVLKDVLAMESVSVDYKFVYPDDYQTDLEAAIYSDVENYGSNYLDEDVEFADENGVVYPWVKARREMFLAKKGITAEEWERVFFLYKDVFSECIISHLESVGAITADSDDALEADLRAELEEQLESFLADDIKVDILYYEYKTDDDSSSVDDALSEDESTDETGGDEIPVAEYNKNLLDSCNATLEALVNGERTVEEELENAGYGESDAIVTKSSIKEFFGDEAADCKVGDIKLFDTEYGVYILVFKDLTADDFGRTTDPTEDELESARNDSLSSALDTLLNIYIDEIIIDESALEKYNRPWEITE